MTYGELLAYSRGYAQGQWGITSEILAAIHNSHITRKKDFLHGYDFNPMLTSRDRQRIRQGAITGKLSDLFNKMNGGNNG